MMALTICKECGKEISTSAESCPNCGYKTKQGTANKENPTLRIKIGIYAGIFLLALVLFIVNAAKLLTLYDESQNIFAFVYYDLEPNFTFMEYLSARNGMGVLLTTIISALILPLAAVSTLKNIKRYKRNKDEATNERILYGKNATKSPVQARAQWSCACGRVNPSYVTTCNCGNRKHDPRMQNAARVQWWICDHCKSENPPQNKHCVQCGAAKPSETNNLPERVIHCPECGDACSPDLRFCPGCGTKLKTDS